MTTVAILNDTRGTWHSGSDAVMDVLERLIAEAEMVVTARASVNAGCAPPETAEADLVLVNGEGTLHHGRGEWLMEALAAAQARGQRTALVNALWQPPGFHGSERPHIDTEPSWYDATLSACDLVATRDPWSFEAASNGEFMRTGKAIACWPDLSIDAADDWQPGDHVSPHVAEGDGRFCPWFNKDGISMRKGETVSVISLWHVAVFEDSVDALRGHLVYVTGEHHGIYAALLAAVPFVAVPSNSWKIEALVDWLGWGRVCQSPDEVSEEIERARTDRAAFLDARERFLALPRMTAADLRRAAE